MNYIKIDKVVVSFAMGDNSNSNKTFKFFGKFISEHAIYVFKYINGFPDAIFKPRFRINIFKRLVSIRRQSIIISINSGKDRSENFVMDQNKNGSSASGEVLLNIFFT